MECLKPYKSSLLFWVNVRKYITISTEEVKARRLKKSAIKHLEEKIVNNYSQLFSEKINVLLVLFSQSSSWNTDQ